jgi:hypothetical protein
MACADCARDSGSARRSDPSGDFPAGLMWIKLAFPCIPYDLSVLRRGAERSGVILKKQGE